MSANSAGHVVINEIHYHPEGEDDDPQEFLELHNPGSAEIDLTGMAFTDGISSDPFVHLELQTGRGFPAPK